MSSMFSGSNANDSMQQPVNRINEGPRIIRVKLPSISNSGTPLPKSCHNNHSLNFTTVGTPTLAHLLQSDLPIRKSARPQNPLAPAQFINTSQYNNPVPRTMDPNSVPLHFFGLPTGPPTQFMNQQSNPFNPSVQFPSVPPMMNLVFPPMGYYQSMPVDPYGPPPLRWQQAPQSMTSLGAVMTTPYYTAPRLQSTALPNSNQTPTSGQALRIISTTSLNQQAVRALRGRAPPPSVGNCSGPTAPGTDRPRIPSRMHTSGTINKTYPVPQPRIDPSASSQPTTTSSFSLASPAPSPVSMIVTSPTEPSIHSNPSTAGSLPNFPILVDSDQRQRGRTRKNPHPSHIPVDPPPLFVTQPSLMPSSSIQPVPSLASSSNQWNSAMASSRPSLMERIQSSEVPTWAAEHRANSIGNAVLVSYPTNPPDEIRPVQQSRDPLHQYSCTQCPFTASRMDRVQRHMSRRHSIVGVIPPTVAARVDIQSNLQLQQNQHSDPVQIIPEVPNDSLSTLACPQIASSVSLSPRKRVRIASSNPPEFSPPASFTSVHRAPPFTLSFDMSFVPQIQSIVSLSPYKAINPPSQGRSSTSASAPAANLFSENTDRHIPLCPVDSNAVYLPNGVLFREEPLLGENMSSQEEIYVNLASPDDQSPEAQQLTPEIPTSSSSVIVSSGEIQSDSATGMQLQETNIPVEPDICESVAGDTDENTHSGLEVLENETAQLPTDQASSESTVISSPVQERLNSDVAGVSVSSEPVVESEHREVEVRYISSAPSSPQRLCISEAEPLEPDNSITCMDPQPGAGAPAEESANMDVDRESETNEQASSVQSHPTSDRSPPSPSVPLQNTSNQARDAENVAPMNQTCSASANQISSRVNSGSSSLLDSVISDDIDGEDDDLVFVGFDLAGKVANKQLFHSDNCNEENPCLNCSYRQTDGRNSKTSPVQNEKRPRFVLKRPHSHSTSCDDGVSSSPNSMKMPKHCNASMFESTVSKLATTPVTSLLPSSTVSLDHIYTKPRVHFSELSVSLVPLVQHVLPNETPLSEAPVDQTSVVSQKVRRRRKSPLRPLSTDSSDLVWEHAQTVDHVQQAMDASLSVQLQRQDIVDLTIDSDSDHNETEGTCGGKTSTPVKSALPIPVLLVEQMTPVAEPGESLIPTKPTLSAEPTNQPEHIKDSVEEKDPRLRIMVDRFTGEIFVDGRPLRELVPGIKVPNNRARSHPNHAIVTHTRGPLKARPLVEHKRRRRNQLPVGKLVVQSRPATRGRPRRCPGPQTSERHRHVRTCTKSHATPVHAHSTLPSKAQRAPNHTGNGCPSTTPLPLCLPSFVGHTQSVIT